MRFEDISAKANVSYHKTLNPAAWEGEELHKNVRLRLLTIAKLFVKYLEIPNFKAEDIVLTGSMANFNWTKYSDFDLHIVTDYSSLECDDIAEAFYNAKKRIWNDEHNIFINGHEVEIYVEDSAKKPVSQGIFSVLHNKWLSKPTYSPPRINDTAIETKVAALVHLIQKSIDGDDDDLTRVIEKIYKMRQAGLAEKGEFSTENLAFKVLRNQGYLDKLHDARTKAQDRKLSIK